VEKDQSEVTAASADSTQPAESQPPEAPSAAPARWLGTRQHAFHAVAFAENFVLKDLAQFYPEGKRTARVLRVAQPDGGHIFYYPSGVIVFLNVSSEGKRSELDKALRAVPKLKLTGAIHEDFMVQEDQAAEPSVADGVLTLNRLTSKRAGVIANTVAQSAAMEYYEKIVEDMFVRTDQLVERLELRGTVPFNTRMLHQFIGAAIGARNEVLSVLHLFDKPDEVWDDPALDRIYDQLRAEFDLSDRYTALELKLRSIQEALELVLEVARDRRLVILELAIVLLIVFEIVLALANHR
jgi:uncharacterized Rmd1/YagE family protein